MKEAENLYGDILLINAMAEQMKRSGAGIINIEMAGEHSEDVLNELFAKLQANDIEVVAEDIELFVYMTHCQINVKLI